MNNDLQNYLNSILQQKVEYITPENIKEGVTVLGVNGDVTELNGQNITITPTTEVQDIAPDENYNGITHITVEAVTSNISPNILPDNIKLGVEILGTVGNLELIDTDGFFEVPANVNQVNIIQCIKQIPSLNIENITSLDRMFSGCSKLEGVPNMDTSNVTSMLGMFTNCTNLVTIPNFNTSNVTNMWQMFSGCTNLSSVPNFDTSNVESMSYMFANCENLVTIPNFNTSSLTNIHGMFNYSGILDIPNLDFSNVTLSGFTFSHCNNLQYIDNLQIPKTNTCSSMFTSSDNLLYVNNINIQNCSNIERMFHQCKNIISINFINTDSIFNCQYAFWNCFNLYNIIGLNLYNIYNGTLMFSNCRNLKTLNITNSDTHRLSIMNSMFDNCRNLENLPIFNFNSLRHGSSGYYVSLAFRNCISLSNNSLLNIISSISNIDAYNTTLLDFGLSEEQANICVNFDIWQDCVNNGWTTGY